MKHFDGLIVALVLAAGMAAGSVPVRAQENPNEPGTKRDIREDREEIERTKALVASDEAQLRADQRQFGSRSPQAREDRARLKHDRRHLRRLRRDIHRDREQREERREERREQFRDRR